MAQWVSAYKDLRLDSNIQEKSWLAHEHTCNPSAGAGTETGGLLGLLLTS